MERMDGGVGNGDVRSAASHLKTSVAGTTGGVDAVLRGDPAEVYASMDSRTRDDYRRTVERLAKKSGKDALHVASRCLELAREAARVAGKNDPSSHVGYYLVGDGEKSLRRALSCRADVSCLIREASTRVVLFLYLCAIFVATAVFAAALAALVHAGGVRGGLLLAIVPLLVVVASQPAVGLINFIAARLADPRPTPRLDFRKGIPPEQRTLVAVSVLLRDEEGVDRLLRSLESHFLNNRGDNVHFGVLADFPDAPEQNMPEDRALLNLCRLGIARLNDKYPVGGGANFFLFHRSREWNESERAWTGWERKRGKLEELNLFLRGETQPFSHIEGAAHRLCKVRYVVTLDDDAQLPRDAVRMLVGAMAHPLARPLYDARLGRVVGGHGILQPRVETLRTGPCRSLYARLCAREADAGLDVYQELFNEGMFVGMGIYDVDVYERALGNCFPDSEVLGHDRIAGCVARSGLDNGVKVCEETVDDYPTDMRRLHRRVRGDWQLVGLLFARETRCGKTVVARPLGALSKWKIVDSLRQSLVPIAAFLSLALVFAAMTTPIAYAVALAAVLFGAIVFAGLGGSFRSSRGVPPVRHRAAWAVRPLFCFACLPCEAYVCVDAILRGLWRLCVSRRLLLQWNHDGGGVGMWAGPAAAIVVGFVVAVWNPALLQYVAPLLPPWLLSPLFVRWLSMPRKDGCESLTDTQRVFLRRSARRVWLFFESFVTAEEHWLPPALYREYPVEQITHSASPTDMGLSLLANLSAYDFGYITAGKLLERTRRALESMNRLERHRGHFYSGYDTRTLKPLRPMRVSTVDSGNLAAYALVLASGLRELAAGPVMNPELYQGLADTLSLAVEDARDSASSAIASLTPLRRRLLDLAATPPVEPHAAYSAAVEIAAAAETLAAVWRDVEGEERSRRWLAAFAEQCRDSLAELRELMPWAAELADRPEWRRFEELNAIPSLMDVSSLGARLGVSGDVPEELAAHLRAATEHARRRLDTLQKLLADCEEISRIDLALLYDPSKQLLSAGYDVAERRLDNAYCEILASEARLTVYLGIARNTLPQSSWFALGRTLSRYEGRPVPASRNGSISECLLPLLVMPAYENTLLDETCKAHAAAQFGCAPVDDFAATPHASMLAAMILPAQAASALMAMRERGGHGIYGFYEDASFTTRRQGMSLVALGQALLNRPMHRRFDANPLLRSASLLLREAALSENGAVVFRRDGKFDDRTEGGKNAAFVEEQHERRAGLCS